MQRFLKNHPVKSRGAGLVVQMELVNFLKEHGVTTEDAISLPAYKRQYISKDEVSYRKNRLFS
jgi:hypothetical protein